MPKEDKAVQVGVTIPASLQLRLKEEAKRNYRSFSAEVAYRLIKSLETQDQNKTE